MLLHTIVASALFLASGSVADYGGYGGTGGGSSTGMSSYSAPSPMASETPPSGIPQVFVQVVQVSNDTKALKYFPESITAEPGTLVQFQFHPANHTVTQSTFDNPCVPISKIMPNVTGIKSGFMPVAANATEIPVFTIEVNDTKPIWIYCGQPTHCQKGMAMVINQAAGSNKTLEAYKAAAALVPSNTTAPPVVSSIASSMTTVETTALPLTSTATVVVPPTTPAAATATSSIVSIPINNSSSPSTTVSSGPAQQTTNAGTRTMAGYGTLAMLLFAATAVLI